MPGSEDARPPYDLEAETAVIGALLLDETAVDRIGFLTPGDFYRERNGWMYEAILSLYHAGKAVDVVTMAHELTAQGRLEAVGGHAELSRFSSETPTALHVEHYAEIVSNLAFRRRLIGTAGEIARIGYAESDREKATGAVQDAIQRVLSGGQGRDERGILHHKAALEQFTAMLEIARERTQAGVIVSGLPKLDALVRLRPASLTVIAGATGHGKTILCERYAESAAMGGKHVVYFHYELTNEQMLWRRAARHSNVPYDEWETGRAAGQSEAGKLQNDWNQWPGGVTLIYCPGWTLSRLVETTRRLEAKKGADLVIVDYAQKVPREGLSRRDYTDTRALGMITNTLKNLADTLPSQPPVILASQLNRSARTFDDCTLDALRDSGEIAEYSNAVLLVWNDHRADKTYTGKAIRIRVDKNTFGPAGTLDLEHQIGKFDFR